MNTKHKNLILLNKFLFIFGTSVHTPQNVGQVLKKLLLQERVELNSADNYTVPSNERIRRKKRRYSTNIFGNVLKLDTLPFALRLLNSNSK